MANTLIVHGCGGAGINICDKVFTSIAELGDGFANIVFNYLDTSRANIDKIKPQGDFWLVQTKAHSKVAITGSGGERRTHAEDIMKNIDEYLDNRQYMKRHPEEFHIVVFSASGGTGAVAGPVLVRSLVSRDIPTIALFVGDSSNGLNCMNTVNTIATLDNIAQNCKKPISVIYVNNHSLIKNNSLASGEQEANRIITNIMTTISLFLSGELEAIDNQDMFGIIDQSHYKTIPVKHGLYGILVYTGIIDTTTLPSGSIPTVCRTLTLSNEEYDVDISLLHHKRGFVTKDNAITTINATNFPLHMLACANFLSSEMATLQKLSDDYYNRLSNIEQNTIKGTANSKQDETTGLIF